jgi:hypothetical protein
MAGRNCFERRTEAIEKTPVTRSVSRLAYAHFSLSLSLSIRFSAKTVQIRNCTSPVRVDNGAAGWSDLSRPLIEKENAMSKFGGFLVAGTLLSLSALMCVAQNHAGKNGSGQLIVVFKDGHRQTINVADVARIEFSGGGGVPVSDLGSAPAGAPPRGHFLGKWEVGDGSGGKFYITLDESGDAHRSLHSIHGKWVYVNGEARVTWDDGAKDAIRKVGGRDQKYAYRAGKSFTDEPDNVADAHNTTTRPI